MHTITALIERTVNSVLDEWTAEAADLGVDPDVYISDRLDQMEETNSQVCITLSAAYLKRVIAA